MRVIRQTAKAHVTCYLQQAFLIFFFLQVSLHSRGTGQGATFTIVMPTTSLPMVPKSQKVLNILAFPVQSTNAELCWYKHTNTGDAAKGGRASRSRAADLSLLALLVQKYKYSRRSASLQGSALESIRIRSPGPGPSTQCASFTGTKVQILTQLVEVAGQCA
jgi:hypothetical protein